MSNDEKLIVCIVVAFLIIITITVFFFNKKLNKRNESEISKLSMISEVGHEGEEFDKCFRLSTIIEEDYNDIDTNRISINIIMETNGNITVKL